MKKTDIPPQKILLLALSKGLAKSLAESSGTARLVWKRRAVSSELLHGIQRSITKASFLQASITIQGGGQRFGDLGRGVTRVCKWWETLRSGEFVVLNYGAIGPFLAGPEMMTWEHGDEDILPSSLCQERGQG